MLIRRFGITEGNRQTFSLGMTLDQLVNPRKFGAIEELWLSQAPPGERLDEFMQKELKLEAHVGETPLTVIYTTLDYANKATTKIALAAPQVKKNRAEFERLRNDIQCLKTLAQFYDGKVSAAINVLRFTADKDIKEMQLAEDNLAGAVSIFAHLVKLTRTNYHFANSMQTGHRKIPFAGAANGVGTNYHWSQVLPLYEKELRDFQMNVARLKAGEAVNFFGTNAPVRLNPANPEIAEPK